MQVEPIGEHPHLLEKEPAALPRIDRITMNTHVVLNITMVSYTESVDFGVIACERSVPHVSDIALGFGAAVADLHKIALEKTRTTPSMRRKRMTPVAAPPSVASN